jgi:hypothetical protein
MAAPRISDQGVGGWYRMMGDDDEGGDAESSSPPDGYCSLSEAIVTPDSAMGLGGSSEAMASGGWAVGGGCVRRGRVEAVADGVEERGDCDPGIGAGGELERAVVQRVLGSSHRVPVVRSARLQGPRAVGVMCVAVQQSGVG